MPVQKLLGYILIDYQADNIQTMLNSFLQYSNVQAGLIDSSGLVTMKTGMESNLDSLLKQGKLTCPKAMEEILLAVTDKLSCRVYGICK